MRVLFINTTCGVGSHGKICVKLAREYEKEGYECKIAYGRDGVPGEASDLAVKIGGKTSFYAHVLATRIFDTHGLHSKLATQRFLKWADEYNPDILWMHNLHGYYLNIEMLFKWIKSRPNMEVKWTLHDCWPFTGHCTNFGGCKCEKWKNGCHDCIQKKEYPNSYLFDNSKNNYEKKKACFSGVNNLTIYTPSKWLANIVKQGFLSDYNIEVMTNPVDKEVFTPRESNFRSKYGLEGKFVILGVANAWQRSKGFYDFIELSKRLDKSYAIVMVGLTDEQKAELPSEIIGLGKTANATELAQIYTAADIFANPSTEETFGMTAYEALLCGTTAVVYKGTACEEIANEFGGIVIDDNVEALYNKIVELRRKQDK